MRVAVIYSHRRVGAQEYVANALNIFFNGRLKMVNNVPMSSLLLPREDVQIKFANAFPTTDGGLLGAELLQGIDKPIVVNMLPATYAWDQTSRLLKEAAMQRRGTYHHWRVCWPSGKELCKILGIEYVG